MYRKIISTAAIALTLVILSSCSKGVKEDFSTAGMTLEEKAKVQVKKSVFNREKRMMLKRITGQTPLGDHLTFGLVGFIGDMNPLYSKSESSQKLNRMLYKNLYNIKYESYEKVIADILTDSVEVSDDGKVIKIRLRNGIKWHDGKPMTADDLIYTYNYLIENRDTVYCDVMYIDGSPVKLKKLDNMSIEVVLPRYSNYFIDRLAEVIALPKHIYEGRERDEYTPNESEYLVGNSAYRFAEYKIHEKFNTEVVEFEYAPGSVYEEPEIKKISYQVSANDSTNRFDLMDNNMQAGYVQASDTPAFNDELFITHTFEDGFNIALLFKVNNDHVSTQTLRSSIVRLINPTSYTGLFGISNNAKPATGFFSTPTIHKKEIYSFYDTSSSPAVRELQNYQLENYGKELRFGFVMGEGEYPEKFAIMIQESFRVQGIKLKLIPLFEDEFEEALKDPKSDIFDFCLLKYPSFRSPDAHKELYTSDSSSNYSGYKNPELDMLWTQADSEKDYLKSQVLYDKIQEQLYAELPMYPLVNVKTAIELDDRLRGVDEAVLDYRNYMVNPEKLYVEEFTYDKTEIEKYEYEPKELEFEPRYDRVNILMKEKNAGKVKQGE